MHLSVMSSNSQFPPTPKPDNIIPPSRFISVTPATEGLTYLFAWIFFVFFATEKFLPYSLSFTLFFALLNILFRSNTLLHVTVLCLLISFHSSLIFPTQPTNYNKSIQFDYLEGFVVSSHGGAIDISDVEGIVNKDKIHLASTKIIGISSERQKYYERIHLGQRISLTGISGMFDNTGLILTDDESVWVENKTYSDKYFSMNSIQVKLKNRIEYYLESVGRGIFKALMLGDRRDIPKDISEKTKNLGIFHLFAISGLHTGLIILFFGIIFRWLSIILIRRFCSGELYIFGIVASIILTLLYIGMINFPITAIRSLVMISMFLLIWLFVGYMPWYALLPNIVVLMIVAVPEWILHTAFQLSFLSVAGIFCTLSLVFSQTSNSRRIGWRRKLSRFVKVTVVSSILIAWFTMPIISSFDQPINLLSPLNNLLHISFFTFFVLPVGISCALISLIFLNAPPLWIEYACYRLFDSISGFWVELINWNHSLTLDGTVESSGSWTPIFVVIHYLMISIFIIFCVKRFKRNNFTKPNDILAEEK